MAVKLISEMSFKRKSSFTLFLPTGQTNGISFFFVGRLMQAATSNV
jgi:hypothetical protein